MKIYTKYQTVLIMRYGLSGAILSLFVVLTPFRYLWGLAIIAGFLLGIFVGSSQIFLFDKFLNKLSFWKQAITRLVLVNISTILLLLIILPAATFWDIKGDHISIQEMVYQEEFGISVVMIFVISGMLITYFQVEKLIGRQKLVYYMIDRYKSPYEENRIFMFLDLNSSTTLTEELGNEQYYRFLNDFITDTTIPILKTKAEIYQYVGDEIVFSWKLEEGVKNNNCIDLFYNIKNRISRRENYYIRKYNVVPRFKAALHNGSVVSAQIGHLKNEIIYCGDPLNTTSRIEALCKKYDSELLISGDLVKKIYKNGYHFESIGKFKLRGKKEAMDIYRPCRIEKTNCRIQTKL